MVGRCYSDAKDTRMSLVDFPREDYKGRVAPLISESSQRDFYSEPIRMLNLNSGRGFSNPKSLEGYSGVSPISIGMPYMKPESSREHPMERSYDGASH
tara:strand:- start:1285 stop:1578 length:294 start_codon:yes stop_codon:yes gene_type:complete